MGGDTEVCSTEVRKAITAFVILCAHSLIAVCWLLQLQRTGLLIFNFSCILQKPQRGVGSSG